MRYEDAVVVAIDDKDPDLTLLRWAAGAAQSRETGLVVVHICEWQPGQHAPEPMCEGADSTLRVGPERAVGAALDMLRTEFPGLTVSGAIGTGRPTPALLRLSEEAALIAVGSHGVGGFAGMLMGSVAGQVAEHAHCPVAVVRPTAPSAADVVVGVDGSPEAAQALRLAIAEARHTGGTLIAVHAFRFPPVAAAYAPNPGIDIVGHRQLAEDSLTMALGAIESENPDLKIERRIESGPAARELLAAADGAAALVVGARGLGGFAGMVTGSVSQQVLRHAHCPVLVAH
jgi:nucleotide-binding universal stress UspA family protein